MISIKKTGITILVIAFCMVYLFPVYLVLVNSFKNSVEVSNIMALPQALNFQYYTKAMEWINFPAALINSFIVSFFSIAVIVILASMTAWMLVRSNNKLSKLIFIVFAAAMLIPFQALMMPLIELMSGIKLKLGIPMIDSLGALIFMNIGFGAGTAVFLYHGFIKSIPLSLEEAALIDGCSTFGVFWRIVFPMLKPVTVTIVVLDLIWIWNDYLLPSLVITGKVHRTIPLAAAAFFSEAIPLNIAMAGLMLTLIPALVFYLCAQKYIVKAVAAEALK